jgi:hypothetical protein
MGERAERDAQTASSNTSQAERHIRYSDVFEASTTDEETPKTRSETARRSTLHRDRFQTATVVAIIETPKTV